MAVIPRGIYDACEDALKRRESMIKEAESRLAEARARAYDAKGAKLDPNGGGKPQGGHKSPTETGAETVIKAEEQLERARKWQDIFTQLDKIFEGREESKIAEAIYQQHKQQLEVAEALHYDRQSIRRFRDVYICHCALLAAESGLLSVYETAAAEAAAEM